MRKYQMFLVFALLVVLSGCKEVRDIPRENGIDDHIMEVTIIDDEEYHIKGEIQYHSENDLSELYLMMFANTHYEGSDRVVVNSIKVDNGAVTYEFEGADKSA